MENVFIVSKVPFLSLSLSLFLFFGLFLCVSLALSDHSLSLPAPRGPKVSFQYKADKLLVIITIKNMAACEVA